jgi:hypothetical protein
MPRTGAFRQEKAERLRRDVDVEKSACVAVPLGGAMVVGVRDLFSSVKRFGLLPHGAAILRAGALARGMRRDVAGGPDTPILEAENTGHPQEFRDDQKINARFDALRPVFDI